jgi:hypothetical protein
MNLKQFLNPDRRKIVVFIIFFIGFILFSHIFTSVSTATDTTTGGYANYSSILTLAPHFILYLFLFSYLLSCLIVWIYDNFKKVKKKK